MSKTRTGKISAPYDDIMDMPRPLSSRHVPMERANRAAQFAPFAALSGYEEAVADVTDMHTKQMGQER